MCWFDFFFFFFFFSLFSFFYFLNVKCGVTPLYIAAENGHKQIVQILMEKGKPNIDLPDQVLLFLLIFFFQFLIFSIFFKSKGGSNSSFYCCWKGTWTNCSNFIGKRRTKCWSWNSGFSCWFGFFFFFFSLSQFFDLQKGATPLFIAAFMGHEQIVELLLEKGKSNVDLAMKVLFFF